MPTEQSINALLSQLCEELGFCSALRAISRFPPKAVVSPGDFVDAVFGAENLSAETDPHLTEQVRTVVDKHFAKWLAAEMSALRLHQAACEGH
jgi:hypothetical protein